MSKSFRQARWVNHVGGVHASRDMADWLVDTMSLTRKLQARSQQFRVHCLEQKMAIGLTDECSMVAVKRGQRVHVREVLLCCDGHPSVFAHTIVPLSATAQDWPFFKTLGERSLGSTLFGDPKVERGPLQFARLGYHHPLVRRTQRAVPQMDKVVTVYARRCLFKRRQGVMLVTELFLPGILDQHIV